MANDTENLSNCWMRFISDIMDGEPIQREEYNTREESFLCGSVSTLAVVSSKMLGLLGPNKDAATLTGADIMGILQDTFREATERQAANYKRGNKNA